MEKTLVRFEISPYLLTVMMVTVAVAKGLRVNRWPELLEAVEISGILN